MAHLYNLLAAVLFLLVARCLAHSSHKRDLVRSAEHTRDQYHPPLGSTNSHGNKQDELEMLNIVLLASVDGKLHALNRATGEILWSMASSGSSAVPSTLSPLVRTQHVMNHFSDTDDEYSSEFYVIEPQSGDIYVMSSSNGPLQRLPFTMAQLVEMSPFSFPGEEGSKVFVGKKETSMLLVELETGKVKAAINSECPWDPFEDPFEDVKDVEDELDLDELDGTKPPKAEKPTEVFIGRTGMSFSYLLGPEAHSIQITTFLFTHVDCHLLQLDTPFRISPSPPMDPTTKTTRCNHFIVELWTTSTSNPPRMVE